MTSDVGLLEIAPPEPDLRPEDMIRRARDLIPVIREQQDEAEARGRYSESLHAEFVRAGFSRILQPRRFGGYEFGIDTFLSTMLEIATGDPGTGWCLTLGSSHSWIVASYFEPAVQAEMFGPDGEFRSPHVAAPSGVAVPVSGGYRVTGRWPYASGSPFATWALLGARVPPADGAGPPTIITVALPREEFSVLEDWGAGRVLGMNSSGSNTIVVEDVFVPAPHTFEADYFDPPASTPGVEFHGNPLYLGRAAGPYHASLVVPVIGAARAALTEFRDVVTTKPAIFAPFVPRYQFHEDQRVFGQATAMTDAAEAILHSFAAQYTEATRRRVESAEPMTVERDVRWWALLQQAGGLAAGAVEMLTHRATSSTTGKGQRLGRYFRDVTMYRQHISSQQHDFAVRNGAFYLGATDRWGLH